MRTIHIVEERAPYLLLRRDDDQFVVVERRAGKLYPLHCGRREPAALTDTGAEHAVHPVGRGWCEESAARRLFEAVTTQYRTLAETLW
jgi:hypothetical protein